MPSCATWGKTSLISTVWDRHKNIPTFQEYLEINGFFIYLLLLADLYFIFLIYQVRKKHKDGRLHFMENHKVSNTKVSLGRYCRGTTMLFQVGRSSPIGS